MNRQQGKPALVTQKTGGGHFRQKCGWRLRKQILPQTSERGKQRGCPYLEKEPLRTPPIQSEGKVPELARAHPGGSTSGAGAPEFAEGLAPACNIRSCSNSSGPSYITDRSRAEDPERFAVAIRARHRRKVLAGNLNLRSSTATSAKRVLSRGCALRANGCASGGGGGGGSTSKFHGLHDALTYFTRVRHPSTQNEP
jgi:hypothetical protein